MIYLAIIAAAAFLSFRSVLRFYNFVYMRLNRSRFSQEVRESRERRLTGSKFPLAVKTPDQKKELENELAALKVKRQVVVVGLDLSKRTTDDPSAFGEQHSRFKTQRDTLRERYFESLKKSDPNAYRREYVEPIRRNSRQIAEVEREQDAHEASLLSLQSVLFMLALCLVIFGAHYEAAKRKEETKERLEKRAKPLSTLEKLKDFHYLY